MTFEIPPRKIALVRINRLARHVLVAFVFTFLAARSLALLVTTNRIPEIYFKLGDVHVHHLNYGIIILAGVGAYLLFGHPKERRRTVAAVIYGIGLGLTFDEFAMWLHLEDVYWRRASYDAVVVVASLLGLLTVAPTLRRFRLRHWATVAGLAIALALFGGLLVDSFRFAGRHLSPLFH
jgi:hypothetical protein